MRAKLPGSIVPMSCLLGRLHVPSDLTPTLMVQDILDNIGVIVEVMAFNVMMEGGGGA